MAETKTKTQESGVKPIIVLWDEKSKEGLKYLDSKYYIGFYNTKKENPNAPDLKVYKKDKEGKKSDEFASLWVKVSDKGVKYLTGSLDANKKCYLTGFINTNTEGKDGKTLPKVRIFKQDDLNGGESKEEPKPKSNKKEIPSDDDLPF